MVVPHSSLHSARSVLPLSFDSRRQPSPTCRSDPPSPFTLSSRHPSRTRRGTRNPSDLTSPFLPHAAPQGFVFAAFGVLFAFAFLWANWMLRMKELLEVNVTDKFVTRIRSVRLVWCMGLRVEGSGIGCSTGGPLLPLALDPSCPSSAVRTRCEHRPLLNTR